MPSTCAFLAELVTQYSPNASTTGYLGKRNAPSLPAVPPLTEIYDIGNDFYPGDGLSQEAVFIAPSNGTYWLTWKHTAQIGTTVGPNILGLNIIVGGVVKDVGFTCGVGPYLGSSASYFNTIGATGLINYYIGFSITLTAGQSAKYSFKSVGGFTPIYFLGHDGLGNSRTWVSGYLM